MSMYDIMHGYGFNPACHVREGERGSLTIKKWITYVKYTQLGRCTYELVHGGWATLLMYMLSLDLTYFFAGAPHFE